MTEDEAIIRVRSNLETDFEGDCTYRVHFSVVKKIIGQLSNTHRDSMRKLIEQCADMGREISILQEENQKLKKDLIDSTE